MSNTPQKPPASVNPTEALFTQLAAFFEPSAKAAGLTLRPFSVATFTAMQLAGISVGTEAFGNLNQAQQASQLVSLLIIQTAPLGELKAALLSAKGDFEKFYWEFAFERSALVPLSGMMEMEAQLASNLPAVEAAQVEVVTPPSMEGGTTEKAPGESASQLGSPTSC